jgi:hypothetical protein
MRLHVWRYDPQDPDAAERIHDLECDDVRLKGVVLEVVNRNPVNGGPGIITHWIKTWDYAEVDPPTPSSPERTE